jgi:DNA-binding NarL/FixJ family response regulator
LRGFDLLLPRKSGDEVIPDLANVAPQARVLVVSSQAAPSSVRRALSAGAAGYLPKRSSDRDLVAAIRLVADGAGYVDPELGAKLVNPNGSAALEPLSERERDILHLLRSATRTRRSARSSSSPSGRSTLTAPTSCASCSSKRVPSS